jgi:hypothetical protein
LDYLTTHTSLLPIQCGFTPGFVNYKKGALDSQPQVIKVYQLLAHGRWLSPGTHVSSTTKTGRHNIAESGNQCVYNRIGGVMVSLLDSSAVDRGSEPWSGQTKDYQIGIFASSLSTQH